MGTSGGLKARNYLKVRMQAIGLTPFHSGFAIPFASAGRGADTVRGTNLVALVRGTRVPDRYIVLTAHYDHVGTRDGTIYPGADDNASGTAAVLAIAEWLKRNPPAHSLLVALFDGEEGGLRGARAFVANPPVPLDRMIANVNLDMVSRNARNELYAAGAVPNPQFKPLLDATVAVGSVTLRLGHDTGGGQDNWTNQSDHGAFHALGVPWVYFGVEDHADYHKATDRPDRVPLGFYYRSVQTIAEFVRRLDTAPPAAVRSR